MPFSASHRRALLAAGALVLGLASTGQALAHARLISATPPANGSVTAGPTQLDLRFSEGLNLRFTGVAVTGPDRAAVPLGEAALAPGEDTRLVVPVSAALAPGAYKVSWHTLSSDGHKTSGTYVFTVRP